jgi:hypothetical protein
VRARSLKPGFFRNPLLCELPTLSRLLFAGLWCLADREGRLEEVIHAIRAEVFPYEKRISVDGLLGLLASAKDDHGEPAFIVRYEANGHRYIQIVNFTRHQNPHFREGQSRLPRPGKPGAEPQAETRAKPEAEPGGLRTPDSISISGLRTPAADRGGGVVRKSPGTGNGADRGPDQDPPTLGPPRRRDPTRWPAVLAGLRATLDPREFQTWLGDSYELEAEVLTVEVRAPVFVEHIARQWGFDIFSIAKEPVVLVSGDTHLTLVFASEPASAEPDATSEPARSGP